MYYFYEGPDQVKISVLGNDIYIRINYKASKTVEKVMRMANSNLFNPPVNSNTHSEMYTGRTELFGELYVRESENSWHIAATDSVIASLDQDNRFQTLANMGTMHVDGEEYYKLDIFSEETRVIELEQLLVNMLFHKYHSEYEIHVKKFFSYLQDIKDYTQIDWK